VFLKEVFMKAILVTFFVGSALLCGSCGGTNYIVTDSAPDYITRDSLNNSVATVSSQPVLHPAHVVSFGNYLFINEPYQGWHVINNTNPAAPSNVAFITAPGSLDATASNGYLYLQNSVDLVVLSIANPSQPVVVKRMQNVLNIPASPHNPTGYDSPVNGLEIINWHDTTVSETLGGMYF
jgi:hypothetical protein